MTKKYENFNHVKYFSNYDGDTVKFNITGLPPLFGEKMPVRIRGIDAPEKYGKKPCERELASSAQKFVEQHLNSTNTIINLVEPDKEKYFRILANISYNGTDLSISLLENYLAVIYDGGTKSDTDWCTLQQHYFTTKWHQQHEIGETLSEDL